RHRLAGAVSGVWIRLISRGRPLPDVAGEVQRPHPTRAAELTVNRPRPAAAVVLIDHPPSLEMVAPRISPTVDAACGVFPLALGGQAGTQPRRETLRHAP